MFTKMILLFSFFTATCTLTHAQTVNSKVKMTDSNGKNYTGTIASVQGNKYYVKYDGVNFAAWLTRDQFILANATAAPATVAAGKKGVSRFDVTMTSQQEAAIPDISGGMPVLAGSAWVVVSIYEKGSVPKTQFRPGNFLFCRNGKWEHQTGTLFMGGTYKINGTTLTTIDGGKPETWKLRWDGSVKEMEMEQGNLIFVLRYTGKTQC